MSVTLLITNLTAATVNLSDIYSEIGAAGLANDHVTITRSAGQIDDMSYLKALVAAGTVSVSLVQSSDNSDILSLPIEQHGTATLLAVDAATVVTSAVTFDKPFPSVPVIVLGIRRGTHTDWKAQVYQQSVTASGFTIALDVTTQSGTAGEKGSVCWMAIL